jgi:hypothetical protein
MLEQQSQQRNSYFDPFTCYGMPRAEVAQPDPTLGWEAKESTRCRFGQVRLKTLWV